MYWLLAANIQARNEGSRAHVIGEEGPWLPTALARRAEGTLPLIVCPSVLPTGDPDPHLRLSGHARVV